MTPEFGQQRTAIVTGGARRIGAGITQALAADGWQILIHCHQIDDAARALADACGARIVEAELAAPDAAETILAATAGMAPPGLLVNNASGFELDSFGALTVDRWDRHMAVNLRAPAMLTQAFAAAVPPGRGGLVVNLLDAKLAAPNVDFFSYTISKAGLAGLTELAARALAGQGIRICAIAPAVTLVSGPQTGGNFAATHAHNPLGRGVAVDDIVRALRFIVASPVLTGQTITLDGGQRFLGLQRDVQFLSEDPAQGPPA